MLNLNKEKLVEAVNTIQRISCVYDGLFHQTAPDFCDCKYGVSVETKPYSENTGCPELRDVKALFEVMTDKEYERLVSRVEKKIKKNAKLVWKSPLTE